MFRLWWTCNTFIFYLSKCWWWLIFQANNVRSDEAKPKKVKKKKPKIEPSLDEESVQEPVKPVAVTLEEPEEPLMLVDQVSWYAYFFLNFLVKLHICGDVASFCGKTRFSCVNFNLCKYFSWKNVHRPLLLSLFVECNQVFLHVNIRL